MNLKQFLKPNWRKIVIFVVIMVISFTLGISGGVTEKGKSCYVVDIFPTHSLTICSFPLNPLLWIFPQAEINVEVSKIYLHFQFLIKTYFIPFFYWYFLSCLIIWIYPPKFFKEKLRRVYDKLKKKS